MSDLARRPDELAKRRLISERDLLWRTMEGETLRLRDMETKHLFNAMKMQFNHIAAMWGGEPVWFVHKYSDTMAHAVSAPQVLAKYVCAMLREIDRRDDLPAHYREPLALIRRQIEAPVRGELPQRVGE
jgi:hypothetical protein